MPHITIFLTEFLWVLFFLALFSLMGGFLVLPFQEKFLSRLLAAPLAGMLVTALGIAGFYSILALPLWIAATITIILCSLCTIISIVMIKPQFMKINYSVCIFIFAAILFLVFLMNYTSIQFGHPGFLFMDGSDQLGYSQLADWIRTHTVHQRPVASANFPYQSWPRYMFTSDPRFGCLYLVAFISWIQQQSGMFSYDSASCIVLTAGILAVSSMYARTNKTFILLFIALLTCHWFSLSRSGYFGKIFGYPSILFLIGLYFHSFKRFTPFIIMILAIVTCAVSISYPGTVTALLFSLVVSIYLLTEIIFSKEKHSQEKLHTIRDAFFCLIFLLILAVASTGELSLPSAFRFASLQVSWLTQFEQLLEIPRNLFLFSLSVLILFLFLIFSILKRNALSFSLIFTPTILIATLWYFQAKWAASQLIGIFFELTLVGSIWLIDDLRIKNSKISKTIFNLTILCIVLRLSHFIAAAHHYGPGANHTLQFSKHDMNRLAAEIKEHKTIVDIGDVMHALPILVELGRRNLDLEWTPRTWKSLFGYRPWPAPKVSTSHYYLRLLTDKLTTNCKVIDRTNQYQLIHCTPNPENQK